LTYITPDVIVMSLPAMDYQTLYRNHINDVVRFLDEKHPSSYLVVNCCSEAYANYPIDKFHGRVLRCSIDDHNVPPLHLLLSLCLEMKKWMDGGPKRVLVIHCKGGKGRSGSVICAWLLFSRACTDANQALTLFGHMRTDPTKVGRIQGVETASQRRYVNYFSSVVEKGGRLPSLVYCEVMRIVVEFTFPEGEGLRGYSTGSNIIITHTDGGPVSDLRLDKKNEIREGSKYVIEYMSQESVTVVRDTRIVILLEKDKARTITKGADIPTATEIVFFYFWFHTAFVGKTLQLQKPDVDKNRKWRNGPFESLVNLNVEVFFNVVQNNL